MAKSRQKSSKSSREKRAARAKQARAARVGLAREAERRPDELFAEETPATQSATLLLDRFARGPVPPPIARLFAVAGSERRAREVSGEVARLAPDTQMALTLNARRVLLCVTHPYRR